MINLQLSILLIAMLLQQFIFVIFIFDFISIDLFKIPSGWNTIQIIRRHWITLCYIVTSPPSVNLLSFDHEFELDLFLCFAIRILHCIFVRISLCFIRTFTLHLIRISTVFWTLFQYEFLSLLLERLPILFCLYNLTKCSSYTCCTLETMILIIIFDFLMQNPSYNVSDCFSLLADLYFHCSWDSL